MAWLFHSNVSALEVLPIAGRYLLPRQTVEALYAFVEPPFQCNALSSSRKYEYAEPQITENDRVDCQFPFIGSKPRYDVQQVLHSESVDSDSMGKKKFFRGQAWSQSMAPSFRGAVRRIRRYTPRSRRSTSNSCPGSIPSNRLNYDGSTIWPLEEMVVVVEVRYRLTHRPRQTNL